MFTPISVTSLSQGKDLAHWYITRLYGEPADADIDRSEANAEVAVPAVADTASVLSEQRWFLAVLRWRQTATPKTISRRARRKALETSAA